MSFNRVQSWATFSRTWWLYDAKRQCPFRSALVIRDHLLGKHKPIYTPHGGCADIVVVMNSKHIAVEGDYWRRWKHYHDTGYSGGVTSQPLYEVHDLDPTKVIWTCVYKSMRPNLRRRHVMAHLYIYPEENVPQEIMNNISDQIRQVMAVPRTLSEYTAEERARVPRLFEWPTEHILHPGQPPRKPKDEAGDSSTTKS